MISIWSDSQFLLWRASWWRRWKCFRWRWQQDSGPAIVSGWGWGWEWGWMTTVQTEPMMILSSRDTETGKALMTASVSRGWKCAPLSHNYHCFVCSAVTRGMCCQTQGKTHNTPKSFKHTETHLWLSLWIVTETCMQSGWKTFRSTPTVSL